ncbi:helix-turn-helix domain-containing protein [Nocardia amamiensis]|uniref:helix-turn-helix domain-containing protein n=1 Tax=Nocardia amamiensis TaxID=404578 RepID=UPI001470E92F|nr:helix-turn-helix transcriptional regulator [Nocardia amamiensis]
MRKGVPTEPDPRPAAVADRLAREIKRRRLEAGVSQRALATRIGYSRQYVSMTEWENANLPSQELVAAIDTALDAHGALVALRAQAKSDQQESHRQSGSARSASTPNADSVMLPVVVNGRILPVPLDPRIVASAGLGPVEQTGDTDDWDAVINRRALLGQGFVAAASTVIDPDLVLNIEPVSRHLRSSEVSDRTVASFTAVTRLLASQRQSIAPDALINLIAAHRESVAALFRATQNDRTRNQLGLLLGETSIAASRLWSAIGDRTMALATCAFARRLAADIENPALGGIARIFESNLRSDAATLIGADGDIVDGLRMLGEAAAVADLLPPAAQARIAAEQAQAYAVLELTKECQEALTRACHAVDSITEADQTGLFSDWDATRILVYEGTCWLFLGRARKAVKALTEVLELLPDGNKNVALAARVDLATAYIMSGELEAGCRMLGDTYVSLAEIGNRRGIARAQHALKRLDRWKCEQPVRELREHIVGLSTQ